MQAGSSGRCLIGMETVAATARDVWDGDGGGKHPHRFDRWRVNRGHLTGVRKLGVAAGSRRGWRRSGWRQRRGGDGKP